MPARRAVHAGDEARRRRVPGAGVPGARLRERRTTARAGGTAWPSSAGSASTTSVAGFADGDDDRRRGPRSVAPRAAACGWRASTCRTAGRSTTTTTSTSSRGSSGCARILDAATRPARRRRRVRRLQHRPRRPRRVGPAEVRRRDPRQRARAGRARAARGVGPGRRLPPALRRRRAVLAGGTTAPANFHKGTGHAHRPRARHRAAGRAVAWALIDRNARKGKQPSDHAPLVVDLDV